jgi:D-serine deaminase-like pyridoxal phosphate-dependent protein
VTTTATLTADVLASHPELAELATPALVLHGPRVRHNIQQLADYAATVGIGIRPHTKTHKSREIARLQLDAGAIGITVAKVSEAEAISDPDDDVLLAYPPVGVGRAERLAQLAHDRTMRAAIDSLSAVEQVSAAARSAGSTVGLLVDFDIGLGRTGVQSAQETLVLAKAIDHAANVRLDGIMIYPGQIGSLPTEQANELKAIDALVAEALALWAKHGLVARIISGGSTPTAYQSHLISHQTEIRPGTYLFNDMNTVRGGYCTLNDCAARVLATVISTARPGHIVLDAGSKTLAADPPSSPPDAGYGHIVEYPEARIIRLNEEHGQADVRACPRKPKVGDRVTVIPNHICPCVNLRDSMWWWDPGDSLRRLPVDARGRIE